MQKFASKPPVFVHEIPMDKSNPCLTKIKLLETNYEIMCKTSEVIPAKA